MNALALQTSITPEPELNEQQRHVLTLLSNHTYDEVRQETGWSRGKIYSLAMRVGARKNEARIRERREERKQRQVEFLNEVINSTVKCDVLDFLDGIPSDTVALHATSPPYNLGKPYGGQDSASADRMRFAYYHGFLMQVISEMARTLKPGGTLFLNLGSTRDWEDRLMPLDVLVYEDCRRSGLVFQSRIIWEVPFGLTPKRRLSERYETVLVWSKGESQTFNPSAARVPQKEPGKRAFKGPNRGKLSGHPLGAHPSNVWPIRNVGSSNKERKWGIHPAQYPITLAKRGILLYSMPGDIICDCFSGSGTTQAAAIETGRNFLGADLFYEDLRSRRLADTIADSFSVLPGVTNESIAVWQAEARRVELSPPPITPTAELKMIQETFF
jgi:DNA modification methylase